MRRTMSIAIATAALVGLSACGGGSDPLTQEQTRDALLTGAEFPLDGFTAGSITEHDPESDDSGSAGIDDMFADFPGADQLSDECKSAMEAMNIDPEVSAQSSIDFSGPTGDSLFGNPEVNLMIAVMEGDDNPLDLMDDLSASCDEISIEEGGMSMKMAFNEIEGNAQGTKISIDVMGESMEMVMAGREDGGNYVVVMGLGVTEADVISVIDAQEDKLGDL